jgi:hypothetical protein
VAVKWQKPAGATTRQRIRAVLCGALTSANGEQLLTVSCSATPHGLHLDLYTLPTDDDLEAAIARPAVDR